MESLKLMRLLDDLMLNRVRVNPFCTKVAVFSLKWSEPVLVDINECSVTVAGEVYFDANDPTDNQSVISIVGFVQAQLAAR